MADEWVRPPEVDSGRRSSPVGGGGPSIPAHLFFFPLSCGAWPGMSRTGPSAGEASPIARRARPDAARPASPGGWHRQKKSGRHPEAPTGSQCPM